MPSLPRPALVWRTPGKVLQSIFSFSGTQTQRGEPHSAIQTTCSLGDAWGTHVNSTQRARKLGYYVYLLVNPLDGKVLYVGEMKAEARIGTLG